MKTAVQIDVTFDQILAIIRQLPKQQILKLTKELEKEAIDAKLSRLLKTFKAKELNLDEVFEEVERVRQSIYEEQKH